MDEQQHINILIIEDNPGDQLLLHENLLSTKLSISEVVMADTFADGVACLHKQNFSIIFLDLFLQDSVGLETFSELIKINSKIPVVIYSGLSDAQIALKAITLGAQDFLIKGDYTINSLEKTVRYSIERKSNLDALEESNARFALISKATHDMVWDWDLVTNEVYRNSEGWKKIFKTALSDEGIKEEWPLRVHPEDRVRIEKLIEELIKSDKQELFDVEFRILRENNSIGFVEDRGYIIRDDKGKAIRLIGASHDITERKEAEEELEKLSMVAKQTSNGVIITDANDKISWVNNAFTNMFGYELTEVLGKDPLQFLHDPADGEMINYINAQLLKKIPFVFESIYCTKTGNKIFMRVQMQPIFDENANLKQFFGLQTDITLQKRIGRKS